MRLDYWNFEHVSLVSRVKESFNTILTLYWKNYPDILIKTARISDFDLKRDKFVFVAFTVHM